MQVKIKDICNHLEQIAPIAYQESYDNAGLIIGNPSQLIDSALICLDVTEEVVDEAIAKGAGLIVAHHPLVFGGLKKITGKNFIERCVIKAIKHDIGIYAAHTNLDSVQGGVNSKICEKLNLINCKVLSPINGHLKKLVTFIPLTHIEEVQKAVFAAGAGNIGNYDCCGYSTNGKGTFRGGEDTNPFVGEKGEVHQEEEVRFETIFPKHIQGKVIQALLKAHPYEEVAYDIYALDNQFEQVGIGMIGELSNPEDELTFLKEVKDKFTCEVIKYTELNNKPVKKVAVCGGSGSFLLRNAISAGADIFITGDFKYHQYFDAEGKIVIADIGHYESEQFTKEVFYEILMKKFPKFALHLSGVKTNPVNYLI
ncbi:Nif3-like dinuclear metal center hexameric protein [Puteibacter caeruleilacunae]|nr:Nif3-like dinuclear metal center hexameric protein [Puteibacter caeruleilacunae]